MYVNVFTPYVYSVKRYHQHPIYFIIIISTTKLLINVSADSITNYIVVITGFNCNIVASVITTPTWICAISQYYIILYYMLLYCLSNAQYRKKKNSLTPYSVSFATGLRLKLSYTVLRGKI